MNPFSLNVVVGGNCGLGVGELRSFALDDCNAEFLSSSDKCP